MNNLQEHLQLAIRAALLAGDEIMKIYETDFSVDFKADHSPLTEADRQAHKVINRQLTATGSPVLSEEGKHLPYEQRRHWKTLWIVDPVDGTKEFVKRNGEFTVNIALVKGQSPVLGVIWCPVARQLYFGNSQTSEAYRCQLDSHLSADYTNELLQARAERLPMPQKRSSVVVAVSRSHLTQDTHLFINKIKQTKEVVLLSRGSSLKMCMIAEGSADVYPRMAPTSEWDTAAGQAIIEAAGGRVLDYATKTPLVYNKPDLLNPWFVAFAKDKM
ncbi:MAG: 3'(2'),5'-bisphosphate nucleotidase CysQ [Bacteroidales bacterium]|nr:3'(2'),5'-bisphosphate nucleotidase CysQ [Bacteroidales bacterium]NCU34815.1 3'(2'),5'-bisphosphate nucleotidase [Candidatus Falkowbacteria bacterium]MDD2631709.1 3'(2'),5'-bisphosphate nucleotidase CysQ [Bacteroidales bacterium]MDD3527297.1 3'(2'),5'-bisphosphate nucleotidase CysQ [Bacteroidales bacterium]MDD4176382.1 3'(2'),5'-bisphosphate nucleotidase CysQ [Bacteroidales bacterium]